jgi:hypothetical protein
MLPADTLRLWPVLCKNQLKKQEVLKTKSGRAVLASDGVKPGSAQLRLEPKFFIIA